MSSGDLAIWNWYLKLRHTTDLANATLPVAPSPRRQGRGRHGTPPQALSQLAWVHLKAVGANRPAGVSPTSVEAASRAPTTHAEDCSVPQRRRMLSCQRLGGTTMTNHP